MTHARWDRADLRSGREMSYWELMSCILTRMQFPILPILKLSVLDNLRWGTRKHAAIPASVRGLRGCSSTSQSQWRGNCIKNTLWFSDFLQESSTVKDTEIKILAAVDLGGRGRRTFNPSLQLLFFSAHLPCTLVCQVPNVTSPGAASGGSSFHPQPGSKQRAD